MKVVIPGSFDPVTLGHVDIIERAATQFDDVIVLITANPNKSSGLFSAREREDLIREVTAHRSNISVDIWGGLLVDYTRAHHADALVKGLRSAKDYDYEYPMAEANRQLSGIDTYFLLTDGRFAHVSSSLAKEIARFNGDASHMLPPAVVRAVQEKYRG